MTAEKRQKDWIYIQNSNNETRIASPEYIANLLKEALGIPNIYSRLIRLEDDFDKFVAQPRKKMQVLELLAKEEQPRTRMWVQHRVSIGYIAFQELLQEEKLEEIRKERTYLYKVKK